MYSFYTVFVHRTIYTHFYLLRHVWILFIHFVWILCMYVCIIIICLSYILGHLFFFFLIVISHQPLKKKRIFIKNIYNIDTIYTDWGGLRGVMVKVLDCSLGVSKFKFQLCNLVPFQTTTFWGGKAWTPLSLPTIG